MGRRITGFLHSGSYYDLAAIEDAALAAFNVRNLYLPTMRPQDIAACDSLLLAGYLHAGMFKELMPAIRAFLDVPGHKLVVEAENDVESWLGVREEPRIVNFWAWRRGDNQGRRNVNLHNPLWEYYSSASLNWHFHGALETPEGATPLVVLDEAGVNPPMSIIYHDAMSYAAEIVVSEMDATFHHGMGFMPGATAHLLGSLAWLGA